MTAAQDAAQLRVNIARFDTFMNGAVEESVSLADNTVISTLLGLIGSTAQSTAPTQTWPGRHWYDTTDAESPILKVRSSDDATWITIPIATLYLDQLDSVAAVEAEPIPALQTTVRTRGYHSVGDGGRATYKRAGAEPDHLFKIRSADGAWWEGEADPTGVNVKQFGAVGDGVTDDAPAIQAAVDYIMHGARGGTLILPFGQGEAYAIETTIEIDYSRVGTPTSMVMLHGTGMPDRNKSPAGTLTDKNMIIWTGAAGGTMLRLTDPLDHWLENFCLHGNDLADYCIEQSNTQGGWGHVTCSNIVLQRSRKNLVRYTGAVDGGRNLWWRCTLRKNSPLQGDDAAHNSATAGSTTWTLTDDPDLSGVVAGGQLYVATAGGDRKVYEIASVDDIVKTVTVVETDAPSVDSGAAVDYGIVPLTMQDEALVLYEGANNVEDHYVDIEAIYTVNGYYGAHAFHVASGSPDITIRGGFTKAEVSLYQGTGSGAAFFAAHGVYAEGENFYRADKQVDQVQAFNMVQHAGSGGFFIDISGNSNGRPCKVTGGFTNGSIRVRDRDDFPLILDGFDRRGDNFILDDTAGERTNLIEIGRPATVAPGTHSWIAAAGIINRGPAPENDPALNVNLANGSIFRAHRTGNASLNINAPSNVDPTEDFGARITIVVLAAGTALSSCTWDSEYHFPSGNAPSSPTTNNNSVNIYEFMYVGRDTSDNDVWYCTSMTEDLSRPTF